MNRAWFVRFLGVLSVLVVAGYTLYPSVYYYTRATEQERDNFDAFCSAMPTWMHCKKLNLGLDLQGGVHLVMGVKVEKAVEQRVDRVADTLRTALEEKKMAFTRIERPRNSTELFVQLAADTDESAFEKMMRMEFSALQIERRQDGTYVFALVPAEADEVRRSAVDQAIKTIRNRADKLGVTEPIIAKRGDENILIQLPGVKDPDAAIRIIGRTAQLQFKIVDHEASMVFDAIPDSELPEGVQKLTDQNQRGERGVYFELPESQREVMLTLLEAKLPSSREIGFGPASARGGANDDGRLRTYVLHTEAGITGDYMSDAAVRQNPDIPGDWYVSMTFDTKGAQIFEKLTGDNIGRNMAIVLDGIVSGGAPNIESRIGGGTAQITLGSASSGQARRQEASELVQVLRAGALPAPIELRDKRQVGKTLGQESVDQGSMAIGLGMLLVVVFMFIYYKGSGVIANIALSLNVVLLLAVLALFEATLTLPGMAGVVLTIGMAVDANVIIFERIREELRAGKTPRAAIDAGYGKAFSTILDANITTLIAGVVLMQYGEGPIRGFAVTLIAGILCSMFTAIVVTRLIYDFFTSRRRLQTLSI